MTLERRAGFTLVELMISVIIVGLLASIATPKFQSIRRRATATQILGDFNVVQHAALSFFVDSQYFPEEVGSGELPPNLGRYLPAGFSMTKPEWTLDYENWPSGGIPGAKSGSIIGVSFTTPDSMLGATAMKLFGNIPHVEIAPKYTLLISAF
jgi:prepilin-type N-terminal cleavage/methylation domain-containing protein